MPTLHLYFFDRVKISWNIGDNRNFFLKSKSILGLYHVVLTTQKTSPEKLTLTVVECNNCQTMKKLIPKKKYLA